MSPAAAAKLERRRRAAQRAVEIWKQRRALVVKLPQREREPVPEPTPVPEPKPKRKARRKRKRDNESEPLIVSGTGAARLLPVRYKKPTPCGWREPIIPKPGARMPAPAKSPGDMIARLTKMGCQFGETDADGWLHYTAPHGARGKLRFKMQDVDEDDAQNSSSSALPDNIE